jgi:two-component system, LytTR family, sensor kinase
VRSPGFCCVTPLTEPELHDEPDPHGVSMAKRDLPKDGKSTHFIVGVWLSWTAIAIVGYARHYFESTHPFEWPIGSWPDLLSWLGCFYPWAVLTPSIFRIEERFSLASGAWKRRLGIVVLASLICSYVAMLMGAVLNFGVNYLFGRAVSHSGSVWQFSWVVFCFQEFSFWSTFSAACAIRHFIQFHRQARQATQLALEKSQLETSLRQAELENLRMRLNPHFLFNTLQNISVLAQQNPKLASQMLVRLGDLLRSALRGNVSAETTVSEEMALVQDYLAVEKMRFGDRLAILVDIAPGSDDAIIPSFLLQPLVENAIIHGLRGMSQAGTIAIRAMIDGERLVLTVADNGVGVPAEWSGESNIGIGLGSTRERLSRIFPGGHQFVIRKLDEGGTEIRIVIPYLRRDQPSEENIPSEQLASVDR